MNSDIAAQEGSLGLGKAFLYWFFCTALLAGMGYVTYLFWSAPLLYASVFYYLVAGFLMSRSVLRRLIHWLPYYYTLYNVTTAKMHFFFLWPIAYPMLFVRLAINKAL